MPWAPAARCRWARACPDSLARSCLVLLGSSTDHVDHGEDDNPYGVDEVPVPGHDLDALAVDRPKRAGPREDGAEPEHEEPDDDVRRVEPDERVESRAEEVGPDREAVRVDEAVPFRRRAGEKSSAKRHRREEPDPGEPDVPAPE